MNFGKWIIVSFVLFALFIGTLTWLCVREDISLVSKEYYKEELAYQKQIEREQNTLQLQHKPNVTVIGRSLEIDLADAKIEKGNLKLFCPSNAKRDRQFALSSSEKQSVDLTTLQKGKYLVKLFWESEGKEFYYEQEIFIG